MKQQLNYSLTTDLTAFIATTDAELYYPSHPMDGQAPVLYPRIVGARHNTSFVQSAGSVALRLRCSVCVASQLAAPSPDRTAPYS